MASTSSSSCSSLISPSFHLQAICSYNSLSRKFWSFSLSMKFASHSHYTWRHEGWRFVQAAQSCLPQLTYIRAHFTSHWGHEFWEKSEEERIIKTEILHLWILSFHHQSIQTPFLNSNMNQMNQINMNHPIVWNSLGYLTINHPLFTKITKYQATIISPHSSSSIRDLVWFGKKKDLRIEGTNKVVGKAAKRKEKSKFAQRTPNCHHQAAGMDSLDFMF